MVRTKQLICSLEVTMKKPVNLFISDVHLGSRHAKTDLLLEFLKDPDYRDIEGLYIIGDFIDGWKLKRNWYWDDRCNLIIRRLLGYSKRETNVYYVAGNHDDFLREFISEFDHSQFDNIYIGNEFIHNGRDGKRYLIVHGDLFDVVTKYAKWVAILGDIGYSLLLQTNYFINWIRRFCRYKDYWSISKAVKANVKSAVNFIGDFERVLTEYGRSKQCDGCIVGHIHSADLKTFEDGFTYMNSGDWVESCTAIIEYDDGTFELYRSKGLNSGN